MLPDCSVDAVITDAMYGTSKTCRYDWGPDPGQGDPLQHWQYHQPPYQECLRVVKDGGILAWGQGVKFTCHNPISEPDQITDHYQSWFGPHRKWGLIRLCRFSKQVSGHLWIVQTKEKMAVSFPSDQDGVIVFDHLPRGNRHPCPKPVEEMIFMVRNLTRPGDIILDPFCGLGSTLVAAKMLDRSWIGCDLSRAYCRTAMFRLFCHAK
jgi:site-specific DNA-methyltransferase (adenine-specific)